MKKWMKKAVAVVLTATMVLSISAPACAETETANISQKFN